jgi:2-oxoglutarate dehydrogenase complex dehydrogenase (E1) component-like enzyme
LGHRLFSKGPFDHTYEQFLRDPDAVKMALTAWFREISDLPKEDEKDFVAHYSESAAASDFLHETFQWWRRVGYGYSSRRNEQQPTCTYEQFLRDSDMVSSALVTWFREMTDEEKHEEARFVNHLCRCAADIVT